MNPNIRKEKHFLQFLAHSDSKQTKLIMKIMSKSQMTAICSIIYNALYETFTLKRSLVDNLRTYKKQLRQIVDKKVPLPTRKDLMVRRSHEISELLRTVLKEIDNNGSKRTRPYSETETRDSN